MSVCYELNSNRVPGSRIAGRNDFLCIACTFAIIAGLLFPLSANILDVCLIFSLSLTAALLIITLSANSATQVTSLPLLIILIVAMRTALSIGTVKLIFSQGNPGIIINFFASSFLKENTLFALVLFIISAPVCFVVIYKSVKSICRLAGDFTTNIAPAQKLNIENDFNCGTIDNEQAQKLREKNSIEAAFFIAMAGAGKFMLCATVIEIIILIVNIAISMIVGTVGHSVGLSLKTYIILAIAIAMLAQISTLLTAIASSFLVQRTVNSQDHEEFSNPKPIKKAKVVTNEVKSPQNKISTTDSLNSTSPHKSRIIDEQLNSDKTNIKDAQWFDDSEDLADKTSEKDLNIWLHEEIIDNNTYDTIAQLIESKAEENIKTIILAADCLEELPVTIPINIAIHLAKKNKKCLLIDLDLKRKSISQVFDIETQKIQTTPIATCIENLYALPMQKLTESGKDNGTNPKEVLKNLANQFDHLIVYAPNIMLPAAWDKIACCSQAALLFGPDSKIVSSSLINFHELLNTYRCQILNPRQLLLAAI
ncbi:MAG: hypothetical protein FVQ80_05805 [Planctomycetes bacterium]|nr:hypothetical protein [Planctomycetota bacterium]